MERFICATCHKTPRPPQDHTLYFPDETDPTGVGLAYFCSWYCLARFAAAHITQINAEIEALYSEIGEPGA